MNNHPKLIVTCRGTSIDLCEQEIGNVLFPRDPQVRVEATNYPGLLLVYSSLDADRAYAITSLREYGYVENIIPVHCVLEHPVSEESISHCLDSLKLPREIKLKVRSRGVRGVSAVLYRSILTLLRSRGLKHTSNTRYCLYVETIENIIYLGLGQCHSVFKASILR